MAHPCQTAEKRRPDYQGRPTEQLPVLSDLANIRINNVLTELYVSYIIRAYKTGRLVFIPGGPSTDFYFSHARNKKTVFVHVPPKTPFDREYKQLYNLYSYAIFG